MKFDRKLFFSNYRKEFGGATQIQVDGLNRLLWGFETYYGWWDFIPQMGNALAQIKHETANSFHPVVEGYYLAKNVPADERYYSGDYDRVRKFQQQLKYYPYFGIGDIQLTHRENYAEQDEYLRKYFPEIVEEYNRNHDVSLNLVKYPAQMLDGKISFCAMTVGMHKGTFREGQTLDRYINKRTIDHFTARNIVNGDRFYLNREGVRIGDVIAGDAKKFTKILETALTQSEEVPLSNIGATLTALEQTASPDTPSQQAATSTPAEFLPETPADSLMPSVQDEEVKAEQPIGDAVDTPPKSFINLQDWKPFVVAKLKSVWKWFGTVNVAQFPTLSGIGLVGGGKYWWVGIAAAILFLLLMFLAAILVSGVLLVILFWNRIEQFAGRMIANFSVMNPHTFNMGVKVEKKF